MKKRFLTFVAVLIAALVACLLPSCSPNKGIEGVKDEHRTVYEMSVKIAEELDRVYLTENVTFYNDTGETLSALEFYLYPNAYAAGAENPAYTQLPLTFGGIEVGMVKQGETALNCILSTDKHMLKVNLDSPLKAGTEVTVAISAMIRVPSCDLRLGAANGELRLANFYPILSVFENGDWRRDAFTMTGDPFYSECSDYKVEITVAEGTIVASTGEVVSSQTVDGETRITTEAQTVRDFAICASKNYKILEGQAENAKVLYYYSGETEPLNELKTAMVAVNVCGDMTGECPFPVISIVDVDFKYGGMEYPGLIYVTKNADNKEEIIVHEVIHQWFACAVGSDQINEPWADEALVSYLTDYYYLKTEGITVYEERIAAEERLYSAFITVKLMNNPSYVSTISRTIYEFKTAYEYDSVVYNRGALMFAKVYEFVGAKRFEKGISEYYASYKNGIASGEALVGAFSKGAGSDVSGIVNAYLQNKLG